MTEPGTLTLRVLTCFGDHALPGISRRHPPRHDLPHHFIPARLPRRRRPVDITHERRDLVRPSLSDHRVVAKLDACSEPHARIDHKIAGTDSARAGMNVRHP